MGRTGHERGRWVRGLLGAATLAMIGFGVIGPVLATPGVAFAGGAVSGSVEPKTIERGDVAEFTVTCVKECSHASLNASSIGLSSDIAMVKIEDKLFEVDVTIPNGAHNGAHRVSMRCSDGSFVEVTITIVPHGGAATGDGATQGGVSALAVAGGGTLMAGAGVGGVLLRRRRIRVAE